MAAAMLTKQATPQQASPPKIEQKQNIISFSYVFQHVMRRPSNQHLTDWKHWIFP
jgi:hypothetical protein